MGVDNKEKRALGAYVKLVRAAESLTARVHHHLAASALTMSQFGVLEALFHLGPLTQKEIGRKILRSGGNITMVIDNLEKRRLVKRDRHKTDRRAVVVRLTAGGSELIKEVFPRHAAMVERAFSILSAAEQEQLAGLCRRVGLHQIKQTVDERSHPS